MSLFGGSSETTTTGWKPAMKEFKNSVLPSVQEWNDLYGSGQGIYTGSTLAAEDPLFTQGQEAALAAAGNYTDQYSSLLETLEGFLNYDPNSAANVAARDALNQNVNAAFNYSIRPGIENRGTFSGQFGGPQQNIALGAATEPLSRALADSEVGLMNADRNRALQAMSMAPSLYAGQFLPSDLMQQIGAQRTFRDQAELEDYIQMYEAERNAGKQGIAESTSMLLPLAGLATTTSTDTSQSPLSIAAGLGATYLGAGGTVPDMGSLFGSGGGSSSLPGAIGV